MTSLEMKQGDSWSLQIGWFNPLNGTDKPNLDDPIDISDYSARFHIWRNDRDAASPLLSLTSDPVAGLTVDGPGGTVTANVTPTQTADIPAGPWYWELEIYTDSDNYTLGEGIISVERQPS